MSISSYIVRKTGLEEGKAARQQYMSAAGTQVSDQSSDARIKRYLVNVQPGQVLKAEILQGAVTLNVRYPDGRPVENASSVVTWNARIFEGGEYQIDVMATQPTDFAMTVAVQDGPSPVPGNLPN